MTLGNIVLQCPEFTCSIYFSVFILKKKIRLFSDYFYFIIANLLGIGLDII